MLKIYELTTEHLKRPNSVDNPNPRFSWKLKSDKTGVMQETYRIVVKSGNQIVWDTKKVESDASQNIRYGGEPLKSMQSLSWTVEVSACGDTAISEPANFEMGLLSVTDWKAQWIEPEGDFNPDEQQLAPYIRKEFNVRTGLDRARIYQTAHGLYKSYINGYEETDERYNPGLTSYHKRLQYQVYDITKLLRDGTNAWSVILGDGWWRGSTGGVIRNNFGYKLAYLGQIVLEYADGTRDIITTDDSFKASTGGLRSTDMKRGEVFDVRKEPKGWKHPNFDDRTWSQVRLAYEYADFEKLIATRGCPIRAMETFTCKSFKDANGDMVLDFGQNIAGVIKMRLRYLKPGQTVTLLHGEDIKDGMFSTDNLKNDYEPSNSPFQQITYIARGDDIEEFTPYFAVFGFRYAKLMGYDGDIAEGDFIAEAIYSVCEPTGDFNCSNPLINQLVKNSRWSQKDNFLDVPTDCPTRERAPWTGDSQVYIKTACSFMDTYAFYEKWLADLAADQFETGKIPSTVPDTITHHHLPEVERRKKMMEEALKKINEGGALPDGVSHTLLAISTEDGGTPVDGSAGWGDTAVISPYTLYLCYGDISILERQYESAKKWVDFMIAGAKEPNPDKVGERYYQSSRFGVPDSEFVWDTGFHWGEWLEPDMPQLGAANFAYGDPEVSTAFLAYSSGLLSEIAEILGKFQDAAYYKMYSDKVKYVFNKYFIAKDGTIKDGRQAPQVRALAFDICSSENIPNVTEKLLQFVAAKDYHLNTGFLATPHLLNVLSDAGHSDIAYRVLEQKTEPGWLAPIIDGATTIPENWGGLTTHSGSFNHYAYGAVCDFLFSRVAGIQPDIKKPGYKHFFLKPMPGGTLTHAEATYESVYGLIKSAWEIKGDGITYRFTIPANTTATVVLSDGRKEELLSGEHEFRYDWK